MSQVTIDSLGERIKQRSENVAFTAEQRRAERKQNAAATENTDFFEDSFQTMKDCLEMKLEQTRQLSIPEDEITQFLDEMVRDVSKLQQFLNESSMFLPSFWIKKSQQDINDLNDSVQTSLVELQPKKKFGFKTKKKPTAIKSTASISVVDCPQTSVDSKMSLLAEFKKRAFFGFRDRTGESLEMSSEDLKNRQFHLENLTDCHVVALGNPSSLQFANLKNTTVVVGPTSRSSFIKHCTNCTFVLACQQVRIHNCEKTNFYLHVTGSAIIESCRNLSFGPYTLDYDDKSEHYEQSGLSLAVNYWNKVEDFNWLNETEKSPNYDNMEESEWKKDWL